MYALKKVKNLMNNLRTLMFIMPKCNIFISYKTTNTEQIGRNPLISDMKPLWRLRPLQLVNSFSKKM